MRLLIKQRVFYWTDSYDVYDENGLVHVNWGWGGLDDGYFDINTAAVAAGGYGSDGCYYEKQLALFIHPNNGII